MRLVENWKEAWTWFSVQAMAALVALPVAWTMLPEEVKAMIPADWVKWIMVAIALGGLVGRMVDQQKK